MYMKQSSDRINNNPHPIIVFFFTIYFEEKMAHQLGKTLNKKKAKKVLGKSDTNYLRHWKVPQKHIRSIKISKTTPTGWIHQDKKSISVKLICTFIPFWIKDP